MDKSMKTKGISDIKVEASKNENGFVMIFFHGYDSCARDMVDYLGKKLSSAIPSLTIRFAQASQLTPWQGNGRSWFYVEDQLEGPVDGNICAPRALAAMPDVHSYIDMVLQEENIDESKLLISGFSQGATMAFYAALQRERPPAGAFCISGGALDQIRSIKSKPSVFLLAGADENSFYSGREQAKKTCKLLQDNGFDCALFLTPDNGHNIDNQSIEKLISFVRKKQQRKEPVSKALDGNGIKP
jgi:phospholipase/carboxylesterase